MQLPLNLSMLLNVYCSLEGMSSQLYVLHIGLPGDKVDEL